MIALDQHRHPLRFAVAASTLSGLLVVLFTAAFGRLTHSDIFGHFFLPWGLAIVGWALAASSLVLWARSRKRWPKRVFLIVAAFTQKNWVAELIRDFHNNLEWRGYDLVLKVPGRDYSGADQVRLLDGILQRRREYAGGFIMVNEADGIREALAKFCGSAGMPVVFVDAEPFENEEAYPAGTAFVGYDDGKIGEAAARWVTGYFRRAHSKRPAVLVINGGSYHKREEKFREYLCSEVQDAQLLYDCAGFDRGQAREVTRTHLRRLAASGRKLDAVFCTNDEMALGAVDALLSSETAWAKDAVVAGVDGTPQAKALIEAWPGPLRASVVQEPHEVAETAVRLLERMLRKETVPVRTRLAAEVIARD
jgi:ribose transport system substrate-binding protein